MNIEIYNHDEKNPSCLATANAQEVVLALRSAVADVCGVPYDAIISGENWVVPAEGGAVLVRKANETERWAAHSFSYLMYLFSDEYLLENPVVLKFDKLNALMTEITEVCKTKAA